MRAFTLTQPADLASAIAAASGSSNGGPANAGTTNSGQTKYIAGGTDLLQLAKDDVETPDRLVDLEHLPMSGIDAAGNRLRLEPLARMSDVAAHPQVVARWPALSQALLASASPQIRNMATVGGNLLQRTRCGYFRDTGSDCNKRNPGSGCPAIHGENRNLAILGGSDKCIATYPGDMAVALIALAAKVELTTARGLRSVPVADLHREPGQTPHVETILLPGEMITAIEIPASPAAVRSHYLKVRDRTSFEFALVSAAVAMDLEGRTIRGVRITAGGVGTRPWPLPEVEAALFGKQADPATLKAAADQAGAGAKPASMNAFKLVLLRRTVLRALQSVSA